MFTAKLKNIFFKKNIADLDSLLENQASTYAVLRYAHDIPTSTFDKAVTFLVENIDQITDRRLFKFVDEYIKASGVGILEFTDEYDHTIEVEINFGEQFGDCDVFYDLEED